MALRAARPPAGRAVRGGHDYRGGDGRPGRAIVAASRGWGLALGLAVALGLVVAGSLAGRTVLAGLGAATLFLFAGKAAGLWWRSLGAPLAVLLAGLALLAAAVLLARLRPAARRMVR